MKIEEEKNSRLIPIVVHDSVKSSFRSKEDKNKKKEFFSPQPSLPATVGVGCGEGPAEGRWSVSVTPWLKNIIFISDMECFSDTLDTSILQL